jgi:hypothetical protein
MAFIRAFCGYEPALANMDRLQRNKEQETSELAMAPLDFILLDTVIINDEPQTFVTGNAMRRFTRKEMSSEKHVRVGRIVEHIGQILTPNCEGIDDPEDRAPFITAPGVAYLGGNHWNRVNNWGISPDIFPLGYDLLGDPSKSEHWGHTLRCDKVVRAYIQALHQISARSQT